MRSWSSNWLPVLDPMCFVSWGVGVGTVLLSVEWYCWYRRLVLDSVHFLQMFTSGRYMVHGIACLFSVRMMNDADTHLHLSHPQESLPWKSIETSCPVQVAEHARECHNDRGLLRQYVIAPKGGHRLELFMLLTVGSCEVWLFMLVTLQLFAYHRVKWKHLLNDLSARHMDIIYILWHIVTSFSRCLHSSFSWFFIHHGYHSQSVNPLTVDLWGPEHWLSQFQVLDDMGMDQNCMNTSSSGGVDISLPACLLSTRRFYDSMILWVWTQSHTGVSRHSIWNHTGMVICLRTVVMTGCFYGNKHSITGVVFVSGTTRGIRPYSQKRHVFSYWR